jgi:hypothetical protein
VHANSYRFSDLTKNVSFTRDKQTTIIKLLSTLFFFALTNRIEHEWKERKKFHTPINQLLLLFVFNCILLIIEFGLLLNSVTDRFCFIFSCSNYLPLTYDELEQYIHNTTWHLIRMLFAVSYWLCFIIVLIVACNISVQSARTCYRTVDNITVLVDPTTSDGLVTSTAKAVLLTTLGVTRSPPVI